jgi:hypothetical protein
VVDWWLVRRYWVQAVDRELEDASSPAIDSMLLFPIILRTELMEGARPKDQT